MQYSRNYNFTTGTTIVADQIDQEFDSVQGVVNGNIGTDNLADVSVTEEKIASDAVTTNKIKDHTVTIPKLTNPYKFCAHKTAVQNLTDAIWTDVTWNVEAYDTNSNFDGTSYTAPITGYYHFNAGMIVRHTSGGAVQSIARFVRSDGKILAYCNHTSTAGYTEFGPALATDCYMTAGQTIKVQAYVDVASGTPDIWGEANYTNHFSGHLISTD